MKNLKIYCVTNKTVNFLDNTNYNIGWVGKEMPPENYILCNSEDNIFFKEKYYSELTFQYWHWKNRLDIKCEPIFVNKVKKIKMLKRGIKSILKKPSIFFDENQQSLAFHFDMHHGYGNLKKAIDLVDIEDRSDFLNFVNTSTSYNPHIMFIAKPQIVNRWFNTLFPWLLRCEKEFGFEELQGYDTQRLYAYLAERYLSFWFNKHTKTLAWPWIFFDANQ